MHPPHATPTHPTGLSLKVLCREGPCPAPGPYQEEEGPEGRCPSLLPLIPPPPAQEPRGGAERPQLWGGAARGALLKSGSGPAPPPPTCRACTRTPGPLREGPPHPGRQRGGGGRLPCGMDAESLPPPTSWPGGKGAMCSDKWRVNGAPGRGEAAQPDAPGYLARGARPSPSRSAASSRPAGASGSGPVPPASARRPGVLGPALGGVPAGGGGLRRPAPRPGRGAPTAPQDRRPPQGPAAPPRPLRGCAPLSAPRGAPRIRWRRLRV